MNRGVDIEAIFSLNNWQLVLMFTNEQTLDVRWMKKKNYLWP
jgi:hypothetical protein